jgi:uncharacterized protein (DUF1778 family)
MPYKSRTEPDEPDEPEKRTSRIELRSQPAREERIRYAARMENKSLSAFILEAASDRAEEVIAAANVTVVPADFFDELLASLDEPPTPMPRLREAAKRRRQVIQRR